MEKGNSIIFSKLVKELGFEIYAVAYIGMTHLDLEKYVSKISWMHIGEINKLIKFFKKRGCGKYNNGW